MVGRVSKRFRSKKFKCVLAFGSLLAILAIMSVPHKVYAASLNPDPGSSIPDKWRNYLISCNAGGPALTSWISTSGHPDVNTPVVPVTPGQTSIPLWANSADAVCVANQGGPNNTKSILWNTSTKGLSWAAYPGNTLSVTYPHPRDAGSYGSSHTDVTYAPPGGFPTTVGTVKKYTITLNTRTINAFNAGGYKCAPSTKSVGGQNLSDFANCTGRGDDTPLSSVITIVVVAPPSAKPILDASLKCVGNTDYMNSLTGYTYDPNKPDIGLKVELWHKSLDPRVLDTLEGSIESATAGTPKGGHGAHGFDFSDVIKQSKFDHGTTYDLYLKVWGVDSSGNHDGNDTPQDLTLGPCPTGGGTVSCFVTVTPAQIGASGDAQIEVTINNSTSGTVKNPPNDLTYNVTASGVTSRDYDLSYDPIAPDSTGTSKSSDPDATYRTKPQLDTYTVHATLSSGGAVKNTVGCQPATFSTVAEPYLRTYGDGVSTGLAGGGVCTGWSTGTSDSDTTNVNPNGTGSIIGFTNNAKGSGTQLSAIAGGPGASGIYGFNSASTNIPPPANVPQYNSANNLDFSNDSPPGLFKGSVCPNDFWSDGPTYVAPVYGSENMPDGKNLNTLNDTHPHYTVGASNHIYRTELSSQNINNGKTLTIYVLGWVVIKGNIIYTGAGSWGNISQIPQVRIIATSDIYIDGGVTQLDGTYVSQYGNIYTCSETSKFKSPDYDVSSLSQPPDNMSSFCSNKLIVNGALVATVIKWWRTGDGNNDTVDRSGGQSETYNNEGSSHASEIINFLPELYMVDAPPTSGSGNGFTIDSITSLPPVL